MTISLSDTKQLDLYIGRRIREERIKRGMSQSELAQCVGITYQQAHKYERGINRTSASRLLQIAAALAIDVVELLPTPETYCSPASVARAELELARNFTRIANPERRVAISNLVRVMAAE